ncbi:MAG: DUF3575 domain-containing protein [Marinifilaceae bacterium]
MRRILIILLLLILTPTIGLIGQVGVKTNVLGDAFRLPNLGAEISLNRKMSIDANITYNPWKFSHNKQLKLFLVRPEYRYWLCDVFNGHFFGAHLMGGMYNVMGVKPPFALWSDMKHYRYKGHLWGAGLTYGYQFILSEHWNAEAAVGFGYAYVTYKKYPCKSCPELIEKSHKNYLGPTKAAISLIYIF